MLFIVGCVVSFLAGGLFMYWLILVTEGPWGENE